MVLDFLSSQTPYSLTQQPPFAPIPYQRLIVAGTPPILRCAIKHAKYFKFNSELTWLMRPMSNLYVGQKKALKAGDMV